MAIELPFELKAGRYRICQECPSFDKASRSCIECGCMMLIKTAVADAECPLGKWHKVEGYDPVTEPDALPEDLPAV